MKTIKNLTLLSGIGLISLALTGCFGPKVNEKSVIDYSYSAINPITQTVILTWEIKQQSFSLANGQIFAFLEGTKQGETKTGNLQDPFQMHDVLLVEKVPVNVLSQLGIKVENLGDTIEIWDNSFIFAGTGSEEGTEIAYLDKNSIETSIPLDWSFTVDKIQN